MKSSLIFFQLREVKKIINKFILFPYQNLKESKIKSNQSHAQQTRRDEAKPPHVQLTINNKLHFNQEEINPSSLKWYQIKRTQI